MKNPEKFLDLWKIAAIFRTATITFEVLRSKPLVYA